MCARPPTEVWQQLPARMLTNIKCIATSAAATEMQARGTRGPSRVQQEHRDVVAFILRFFQVPARHLPLLLPLPAFPPPTHAAGM